MSHAVPLGWRVRATVSSLMIPPLLSLLPFSRLVRWLRLDPHGRRPRPLPAALDRHLFTHVARTLARLPRPWRGTCLKRSAVMYHLLSRAGRDIELHIGVRRGDDQALRAHAWLVRNGEPYLEDHDAIGRYEVIARFPDPPTPAS